MADNYQNSKGTLRPSFRLSPTGVELSSEALVSNAGTIQALYSKKPGSNTKSRVLTEDDFSDIYDIEIPSRAIATYSETRTVDGDFVTFYLHNGQTIRIPKTISNLKQAGTVIGPEGATIGNVALYADETGQNLKDGGHGIINALNDTENHDYSVSQDLPTAGAVWNLVGESKLLLYARLRGLIDSNGHSIPAEGPSVAETYQITFKINCSAPLPASFENMKLAFNYSNSIEDYFWDEIPSAHIGDEEVTHVKDGFIQGLDLRLKLYIFDSELGNCYIGNLDTSNFLIEADGNNKLNVFITFDYPEETGFSTGECRQEFAGEIRYILANNDKEITKEYIYSSFKKISETISVDSITLGLTNDEQALVTVNSEDIEGDFDYRLKIEADDYSVEYMITGTSVTLSVEDTNRLYGANLIFITPIVWEHNMARYLVSKENL